MTAPHGEAPEDAAGDQRLDVVVVGGSQAGLAMAWHLARQGRRFVVLEAPPPRLGTSGGLGGTR
jgi:glycine/D-amino acid oxidase-like deaminating enzyme